VKNHAQENDIKLLPRSVNPAATGAGLASRVSRSRQSKRDRSQPEPCEAAAISRLSQADCDAFYELVRPHERALFGIAFSILGRQAEAEEVVQEAVAKAFCQVVAFTDQSDFSIWLMQLVIEDAKTKLRREHRRIYDLLEGEYIGDECDYRPVDFTEWREIPSSVLQQAELRKALMEAVSSLPPLCRSVFVLRDVQQLSIGDVAMVLGLENHTARVLLSRARLKVRDALAPGLGGSWSRPGSQHGKWPGI